MPRNLLADSTLRSIKAGSGRRRLSDGDGFYLLTFVKGGSHGWRFDYGVDGRRKTPSLGTYPAVSLLAARAKADGWSPQYASRWIERMEKDLFPWVGRLPLPEIAAPLLLKTLRAIEARGAGETAHTLRQTAGQVFRYGIATGRCERNPAQDLHGALKPINVKHMAAVLEPAGAGALMRSIAEYAGQPVTRTALLLSALLFQRPGNIRHMEWAEIDLDAATWTIPAAKMKRTLHGKTNGRPHLVPRCWSSARTSSPT